jgi:hypothetical protein
MHTTATVECKVCGAERTLGVDLTVKAAEVAEFAAVHAGHEAYQIHLRLGQAAPCNEPIIEQRQVGNPSLQGM